MSHWAEVDDNGLVLRVVVCDNNDPAGDEGESLLKNLVGGNWVKASINTSAGVHYGPDGNPDGGQQVGYNFPGVGYLWDGTGFCVPQPYPSWVLDKTRYVWKAPIPLPVKGKEYMWNEDTKSWDEPNSSETVK